MTLAERIRNARLECQLSQETLAQRAGMSLRAFRSLERGEAVDPHISTVRKLAEALDVSPYALLEEDPVTPLAQAPPESGEEERRIQYLRSYRTLLTRLANRWQRQAKTMNYSPDWLLELFDTYNDTAEALEGAKLGRDKSLYATEGERLEAGEVFEALMHLDTIVEEAARRQDEEYEKLVSETQEQDELQKRREQEQDELQKRREVKAAKAQKFPQRAKASERLQSPA